MGGHFLRRPSTGNFHYKGGRALPGSTRRSNVSRRGSIGRTIDPDDDAAGVGETFSKPLNNVCAPRQIDCPFNNDAVSKHPECEVSRLQECLRIQGTLDRRNEARDVGSLAASAIELR